MTPLTTRGGGTDGQLEVFLEDVGWVYASQLAAVGHVLAQGRDPRVAPELRMLNEDAPADVEAATAFWFDDRHVKQ